jgi:hypothetical protein
LTPATRQRSGVWSITFQGGADVANATGSRAVGKVKKPHPDFPLFPHASGRSVNKAKGQVAYLGTVSDGTSGEQALASGLKQKASHGLTAAPSPRDSPTGRTGRRARPSPGSNEVPAQEREPDDAAWTSAFRGDDKPGSLRCSLRLANPRPRSRPGAASQELDIS